MILSIQDMNLLFALRHYNDVDHITPLIWKCLEEDNEVTGVLLNTKFDAENDPRLQFLRKFDNFSLTRIDEFLNVQVPDGFFCLDGREPKKRRWKYLRKLLRHSGVTTNGAKRQLQRLDIDTCVFEWSSGYDTSHAEIFEAASRLEIDTVCIPHGLNPHMNIDCTPGREQDFENNRSAQAKLNTYDAIVYQSKFHLNQDTDFGVDPGKCHVLGSTRYYPKWQKVNQRFYPEFEPVEKQTDKTKLVFMVPHWDYNASKPLTTRFIERLASLEWVHVVIKDHTRGETLPEDTLRSLSDRQAVEVTNDADSVSLIKWSDGVINFGSSIGLEALLQGKHHVNPTHLHKNKTIYDKSNITLTTYTDEETIETLRKIRDGDIPPPRSVDDDQACRDVIYGGQPPFDVLERYYDIL